MSWLACKTKRRCASSVHRAEATAFAANGTAAAMGEEQPQQERAAVCETTWAVFTDSLYVAIMSNLCFADLGHVEAVCSCFARANSLHAGPWYVLGSRRFLGMELAFDDMFWAFERLLDASTWKSQCHTFHLLSRTFTQTGAQKEALVCRCQPRADMLTESSDGGVYIEFDVVHSLKNLSLAVLDLEGDAAPGGPFGSDGGARGGIHGSTPGGRSAHRVLTFSPETGTVIRECASASYEFLQLLRPGPLGCGFVGTVGVFVQAGRVAFFSSLGRRQRCGRQPASRSADLPTYDDRHVQQSAMGAR